MSETLTAAPIRADRFVPGRVPLPEPGPDEVLVKVAAAGLAPGIMALPAAGRGVPAFARDAEPRGVSHRRSRLPVDPEAKRRL